ncbi:hypothetical protein V5799_002581 [Amblyomma americanum]|uniref:Uncharacterized protein n=1 Tax=Amblyomma americanum TaxID=6943 RepID=A0AAQ4CWX2_AMBAM
MCTSTNKWVPQSQQCFPSGFYFEVISPVMVLQCVIALHPAESIRWWKDDACVDIYLNHLYFPSADLLSWHA